MVFRFPLLQPVEEGLPDRWQPQAVWPGRTVSGFYLAEYETPLLPGDPAPWREWGNIRCMAKCRGTRGFSITSMAVDNPAALRGGEEVWGLAKSFDRLQIREEAARHRAEIHTEEGFVKLEWKEIGPGFPFPGRYPFLTMIHGNPHTYTVSLKGRHRLCRVRVIHNNHPRMNALEPGWYLGVRFSHAEIEIAAPEKVEGHDYERREMRRS